MNNRFVIINGEINFQIPRTGESLVAQDDEVLVSVHCFHIFFSFFFAEYLS